MGMTSVNIAIRKEAYNFLRSLKSGDKSFSEVILEFKEKDSEKGSAKSLLRFSGILKDVDWEAMEKRMKDFRKEFEKRLVKK